MHSTMQHVAGAGRPRPGERAAGADQAAGDRHGIDEEPHGEGRGVPAAGGEAGEEAGLGGGLVEVERLGIEGGGEGLDGGGGDLAAVADEATSRREVLEVEQARSQPSSVSRLIPAGRAYRRRGRASRRRHAGLTARVKLCPWRRRKQGKRDRHWERSLHHAHFQHRDRNDRRQPRAPGRQGLRAADPGGRRARCRGRAEPGPVRLRQAATRDGGRLSNRLRSGRGVAGRLAAGGGFRGLSRRGRPAAGRSRCITRPATGRAAICADSGSAGPGRR